MRNANLVRNRFTRRFDHVALQTVCHNRLEAWRTEAPTLEEREAMLMRRTKPSRSAERFWRYLQVHNAV